MKKIPISVILRDGLWRYIKSPEYPTPLRMLMLESWAEECDDEPTRLEMLALSEESKYELFDGQTKSWRIIDALKKKLRTYRIPQSDPRKKSMRELICESIIDEDYLLRFHGKGSGNPLFGKLVEQIEGGFLERLRDIQINLEGGILLAAEIKEFVGLLADTAA